jgi:hypothetical protein
MLEYGIDTGGEKQEVWWRGVIDFQTLVKLIRPPIAT